jgi:2-iminobutanoate/2-iminopropanoate deaminase
VRSGNHLFLSGQLGLDPRSGEVLAGVEDQTRQALKNAQAILEAAGSSLGKVVKTTIYLLDLADFPLVNQVYGEFFPLNPPARTTVVVKALPKGARLELELVAEV